MNPHAALDDNLKTNRSLPSFTLAETRTNQRAGFPEISELVLASMHRSGTTLTCLCIAAAFFGAIAFYLFPAQFVGSASVRILQRENYLLSTQQTRAEDATFVRAQSALVLQEQTLNLALTDKVLRDFCDQSKVDDPVEWLKSLVKVEIAPGTDIMNVVAQHSSQSVAKDVSRALTQAYFATITQQLRTNREKRISELERTASEVDDKLMQQWKLLQSKANETGSGSPQSLSVQEQLKIQTLRENSQRLRALQLQRSQLEMQLIAERTTKTPPQVPNLESDLRNSVEQNPEAISLREQIRQCEVKIKKVEDIVQHKNAPQLVKLQNERAYYASALEQLELKIEAMERQRRRNPAPQLSAAPRTDELEQKLALLDIELTELRESTAETEASIAVANGSSGVELEIIRHEIERQEKLADNLWKTIQELRIEERAEPRVAVLSLPTDAAKLSRSKQIKAVASAAGFGCLAAILLVGYVEWYSCIVRSPADVLGRAKMQVFGVAKSRSSTGLLRWKSRFQAMSIAEGANEIVIQLLLAATSRQSIPSILVSSATNEKARSAVAIELANSITQSGRKAILIACDPCPTLTLDNKTEHKLGSKSDLNFQTIFTVTELGFDYVSLDDGRETSRWTSANALPELLENLSKYYDAIVVLGPPMLTNPASLLISKCVDLTLLVGRLDSTRSDELFATREQLDAANCDVLGTLIAPNRFNLTRQKLTIREAVAASPSDEVLDAKEVGILSEINELHSHAAQLDSSAIFHSPHSPPSPIKSSPRISNRTSE